MTTLPDGALDVLIRGGRVLDPATGLDDVRDIGVSNGRIVAIDRDLGSARAPARTDFPPHPGTLDIDASGLLVVPGLVDLHTHVYAGVVPLAVPADQAAMTAGVTTMVSAGDAGAHTIDGFRHLVVHQNRTRVVAFLHISVIGLAGWPTGEALDRDYLDVDAATRAIAANRDIVVGIKVRQSAPEVVGSNGLEPLRRALRVGERTELPVMVHIGAAPEPLAVILEMLRPGDVVTHCFTSSGNGIVEGGILIPAAGRARDRGVIFDVGHGVGSFDYEFAEIAARAGFWPDCISTDLHTLSASGSMRDLPLTMSKFLNLGMELSSVIRATTQRPAQIINQPASLGRLEVGGAADIAVLELVSGDFEFADTFGHTRRGGQLLRARHTIRAGLPWDRFPHPGRPSTNLGG
jgi:dihydroorotase